MIQHIKNLENYTNEERTNYIIDFLSTRNIEFKIQPFRYRVLKGRNIIVNHFCKRSCKNLLLLTAHTNKYFSSPGANDNASGVAVLLGIIENLLAREDGKKLGIKIIFFDHEDGLAYLDGSTYYVKHTDTSNISFVLNLDMVGAGNTVAMNPRLNELKHNKYIKHLLESLNNLKIEHYSFNLPPLMCEDHMPFEKAKVSALSLNLMPKEDMEYIISRSKASLPSLLKESFVIRFNREKHPMFTMQHRHNDLDTSEFVSENSLSLCEKIVMQIIDFPKK